MLFDRRGLRLAAMLCSCRVWEMPFHDGLASRERYVVEVDNLAVVSLRAFCASFLGSSPSGIGQTWAAHMSVCTLYTATICFPTRRYLGTGIVSVCAAKATERSRSVDIAYQTPAW